MRESNIPQEIIDHIKSFTPRDKPFGAPMAILFALFIDYNYIEPDEN